MYIARNSNGCLWLFVKKPIRVRNAEGGYWDTDGAKMEIVIPNTLTWADEPLPVRLEADWINETLNYD